MKKQVLGLINVVVAVGMCLSLIWGAVTPVLADGDFAGGTGTELDPYLVATAEQLDNIRDHLDAHYRLTADINLGVPPWNDGEGWTPLGTSGAAFTGSLYGDGYVIFNLFINRPGTNYQGLFGYLNGAEVRDLRLVDVNLQGGQYTAGLAGRANNSIIENIHVTGEINGVQDTAGLVGYLSGGSRVAFTSTEVDVQGGECTSALVGYVHDTADQIQFSSAQGSVDGGIYSGGLVGRLYRGTISDSYSWAAVHGTNNVGGGVGYVSQSVSYVYRTYTTGLVTGASNVGGLVGLSSGTVRDSYWDTETSGQVTSASGTGKTTAEMQQQATFVNYNFHTLWQIDEDNDYPVFQDLSQYAQPGAVILADLVGSGTAGDPYILTNADELNAMRQDLAAYYKLGNDIDLSASVVWHSGLGWEPVGSSSGAFTGGLDGDGYAIYNLAVNRPGAQYQGLFGWMNAAVVKDLRLLDVSVHGSNYTGGLAGRADDSTLTGVRVGGAVTGGDSTGGLAGYLTGGNLGQSAGAVSVQGSTYTGGLVGYATNNTQISQSTSLGDVKGTNHAAGGLVGYLGQGTITDSYARGSVSGGDNVGGLVGLAGSGLSSYGMTYRAYSTGLVNGTGTNVGGLIGHITRGGAFESYWDTESSGQAASGGGTGKTTAEMQQEATFTNWDFTTVWDIEESESYPFHRDTARMIALIPVAHILRNEASSDHTFEVVSNLAWTATADDTWITVTGGASGRDDGTVTYDVSANPSPDLRTGTITVIDGAGIERVFTVHQRATLEVDPIYRRHDAVASSGHTLNVSGNVAWTAVADDPWIVITTGTPGADAGVVTYRVTENLALTGRAGTITVSGGGLTRTLVHQSGAIPHLSLDPGYAEHGHGASAGHTIAVSANRAWNASASEPWITLDSDAGPGDGMVEYSLSANHNRKSRSGIITVSDGEHMLYFRVTQALSWTVTALVDPAGGGTPSGAGHYGHGSPVTVSVTDNPGYTFTNWTEGGVVVSTNADYHFTARRSRGLVAIFSTSPPAFTSTEVTDATQDLVYTYAITASDPDIGDILTITAETKPPWLGFTENGDGTASLTGTPTNADVGDHNVVLRVTDLTSETDTQSFTITVANVNDAPVFTSVAVTGATQDAPYTYSITATDEDLIHGDVLTITAETKPPWLSLTDNEDGTASLTGTPTNADVGDHPVTLRVTDLGGLFDTQDFTISVTNVNAPPVFTSIAVTGATQEVPYTYSISATDADLIHGDVLTITAETKPPWLSFTDNGDGTASLTGTPTNANVGDHPVTLRVTDLGGLFDTQDFTISVTNANDAPEFTSAPVTSATQDVVYTYSITATDADLIHGDVLTITAETKPPWLSLTDNEDGTASLTGTPTNANVGDHPVTLRVTDLGGLFDTQDFTITVDAVASEVFYQYLPLVVR